MENTATRPEGLAPSQHRETIFPGMGLNIARAHVPAFHGPHLQDLQKSGLSDETIERLQIEDVCPSDLRQLPREVTSAYRLPYFDLDGNRLDYYRLRLFPAIKTSDGHTQKYHQIQGTDPHAYVPRLFNWREIASDRSRTIYIVEGEKKAAGGCQHGFPCIGIGGVWSWRVKLDDHERMTLPMLDQFVWQGRSVWMVPDSDGWRDGKQFDILAGFYALAMDLAQRGATVHLIRLPEADGVKVGLDDWLVKEGPNWHHTWKHLEQIAIDDPRLKPLAKWYQGWSRKTTQDTAMMITKAEDDDAEILAEEERPLTFPEAAWRGPFVHYRAAMAGTSEAPDAAHFAALWAIAAARLRRRVSLYYAFTHYPNVYLVSYGTTGDSKTSASRQALRLLPDDGRVKVLRGVGSAEALGDWMQQPEGVPSVTHLLFIEELATLLTRGKWEGSTLLEFLTQTYDAPPVYEVPFRKNPVKVDEPTPTLIAGTTPEWFWKGIREIDIHGGFGNRLFYFTGCPKPPIPLPAKPDPSLLFRVQQALNGLDTIPPCELSLDQSAHELWAEFYCAWKQTAWEPLTAAALKRIPAYILKLAMVYTAMEGTIPYITRDQLKAAIQVGDYGARCGDLLMQRYRNRSVQGQCEERILKVMERDDLAPWQIHHGIGGRYSVEERNRALKALLVGGLIFEVGRTARNEPILRRRGRKVR